VINSNTQHAAAGLAACCWFIGQARNFRCSVTNKRKDDTHVPKKCKTGTFDIVLGLGHKREIYVKNPFDIKSGKVWKTNLKRNLIIC
jgi:hypothetical protein